MALEKYKEKRNFKDTPEPATGKADKKGALKFVVQRHHASRLHYDFRLEMEGVLKSWAVPKGPSMNPGDKRLAMMVEDHPFEYRTFEGEIPAGNYGAGHVVIWDEGVYYSLETEDRKKGEQALLKGLEKGDLKFRLKGEMLNGEFALVRMKDPKIDNAWLLIKKKDEFAVKESYDSEDFVSDAIKNKKKSSSRDRKPVTRSAKKAADVEIPDSLPKGKMPRQVKPMLAKLIDAPFDDDEWIFEMKWDGYRAIAEVENGKVDLYSRNGISFLSKYTRVVDALKELPVEAVLDGEVVMLNEKGYSQFQYLQNYDTEHDKGVLVYYAFDILYLNGYDLTHMPLIERKKVLKELLQDNDVIRYSEHVEKSGKAFYNQVQKLGLEGIIAKEAKSPYRMGKRSAEWSKIKTSLRQEAIIAGFTEPKGSRKHFGSLVLAVYEGKDLTYIGNSGGGFNTSSLQEMKEMLQPLVVEKSPFKEKVKAPTKITWVKPELVCELEFSEWTADGHMRHPIFQGLREDKNPKEVVREVQQDAMQVKEEAEKKVKDEEKKVKSSEPKSKSAKPVESKGKKKKNQEDLELDGLIVTVSNPDKIYWPDEKITKMDLVNYYLEIGEYMLPYLKDRPESMNRHPNGILKDGFYHKDVGDQVPEWIETVKVYSESNNKDIHYLLCQNQATLTYMNNLGCIEINPWSSRKQKLEHPDYIVIDLDPGENTFDEVIETALVVKEVLDNAGCESYIKTSGATGMHIYIPMGAKYTYDQGKDFAHILVQIAHEQLPDLTSLERSPKARSKQIYLDYLQNRKGQTLAAPYSVRPKPGATVSTPLEWKEVKSGLHPSQFTIYNIKKRVEKKGDLFKGVMDKGVDMMKCLKKLGV